MLTDFGLSSVYARVGQVGTKKSSRIRVDTPHLVLSALIQSDKEKGQAGFGNFNNAQQTLLCMKVLVFPELVGFYSWCALRPTDTVLFVLSFSVYPDPCMSFAHLKISNLG